MMTEVFRVTAESQDKARHAAWCNAFAGNRRTGILYLLSIAAPEMTIRSISAMLQTAARATFEAKGAGDLGHVKYTREPVYGYQVKRRRLGACNTWHLLAVSRDPRFIPSLSEEAVAERIMGDEFTTPMLPEWVPYVFRKLQENEHFQSLWGCGVKSALMRVLDGDLDDIVKQGLANRQIQIADAA